MRRARVISRRWRGHTPEGREELPCGQAWIRRPEEGADHGHARRSALDHLRRALRGDAPDPHHWDGSQPAGLLQQVEPRVLRVHLRARRKHSAEPEVIRPAALSLWQLMEIGGRGSQEKIRPEDRTAVTQGKVVLTEVHAIGPGRHGDVRAIVDDQQPASLMDVHNQGPRRFDPSGVRGALVPVLEEADSCIEKRVHGAKQLRTGQRIVGHRVEARFPQEMQ
jgi:hypothetical protein